MFLTVELVSNNIIEPWLYGARTGISVVAIILAAVFRTLLWGPAGLLLSTPITVCLAVIGRYVPQLRFLDIVLGSAPALPPHERVPTTTRERSARGCADCNDRAGPVEMEEARAIGPLEQTGRPVLCLAGRSTLDGGAHASAVSLTEAIQYIDQRRAGPTDPPLDAPIPVNEAERLNHLHALGLLDTPREERFERVTRQLASALRVPISLVTLVDETRQFWKSQTGLPEDLALAREAPRESSLCGHVVAANEVLVVEDTHRDRRFANSEFLRERGIRFYAGAPLQWAGARISTYVCGCIRLIRRVSVSFSRRSSGAGLSRGSTCSAVTRL